jgi:N-acetylglucosaminyldiphosphoundecaprenol N-acetyl-beta-D-mannosaminyltransferase
MAMTPSLEQRFILSMRVDGTSYGDATERIVSWAQEAQSKYVCIANVHMAMEVYEDQSFAKLVNEAALVTPDGMPLVWGLRALGLKDASRVYGPTLTLHVCEAAARQGIPIGLYGGTPESLIAFTQFLHEQFSGIRVVCQIAPPFRSLTEEEDMAYTQQIVESGAQILLVGIGCPKQERWMADHQPQIPAVMLGVGAAFDFHSGRIKQAPAWMQRIGLEWIFRLFMEPKRLWKRYFKHNPRFVLFFAQQYLGWRKF